ncbi:hypothetical protein POM88_000300 [Heracleum sosnowskyi]|uniref:Endonuclease/exonuclease/phosphatase n=1 Tax=Heracleum sosnowskyi TaxID=360622 RepID=A0AAD8N3W8_9APIA|nr:hypothetical protein POM88_000300 [Heracleum sosnowskyi]
MNSMVLEDEEDEGLAFEVIPREHSEDGSQGLNVELCLVGQFLFEGAIDFMSMKQTMAALWRPGYPFTWEMGYGTPKWIEIRLDRVLVTESFANQFNNAKLSNLKISTSDHSPILLEPITRSQAERIKKFRFENAWLRDPMCGKIIAESWHLNQGKSFIEKIAFTSEGTGSSAASTTTTTPAAATQTFAAYSGGLKQFNNHLCVKHNSFVWTTLTPTAAAASVPNLPSEITGRSVDEIIKEWNAENLDALLRLETEVANVVETQPNLERQLELTETHQEEVSVL